MTITIVPGTPEHVYLVFYFIMCLRLRKIIYLQVFFLIIDKSNPFGNTLGEFVSITNLLVFKNVFMDIYFPKLRFRAPKEYT